MGRTHQGPWGAGRAPSWEGQWVGTPGPDGHWRTGPTHGDQDQQLARNAASSHAAEAWRVRTGWYI